MYASLPIDVYYSACKLNLEFTNTLSGRNDNFNGTGVLVTHGKDLYLISARHLFDRSYHDVEYEKKLNAKNFSLISIKIGCWGYDLHIPGMKPRRPTTFKSITVHKPVVDFGNSSSDIVSVVLNSSDFSFQDSPNRQWIPVSIASQVLGSDADFENSSVGDEIFAFGYPMMSDEVQNLPLVRSGIIASDPSKNFNDGSNNTASFAAEMWSTHGLSGAPVFASEKISVITDVNLKQVNEDVRLQKRQTIGARRAFLAGFVSRHYSVSDAKLMNIHSQITRCDKATFIHRMLASEGNE